MIDYKLLIIPKFRSVSETEWILEAGELISTVDEVGKNIFEAFSNNENGLISDIIINMQQHYDCDDKNLLQDSILTCLAFLVNNNLALLFNKNLLLPKNIVYTNSNISTLLDSPMHIAWHLTSNCNLNCGFCYSRNRNNDKSLSENMKLLDKLISSDVASIRFGGGECFLYDGFFEIAKKARENGIDVKVTTNGGIFNKEVANKILKVGFSSIGISLDGADKETHDKNRGIGSFDKACNTAKEIKKLGIPIEIITLITEQNMDELLLIAELSKKLGAFRVQYKDFKVSGSSLDSKDNYELSFERKKEVWENILLKNKTLSNIELDIGINTEPLQNYLYGDRSVTSCSCGIMSACLRENGDITPCSYSNNKIGNLFNSSIQNIWKNKKNIINICKTSN